MTADFHFSLGTLVQSNVVQASSPAIDSTFTRFTFLSLYVETVRKVIIYCIFIIEVTVGGGVVLESIIMRGVSLVTATCILNRAFKHPLFTCFESVPHAAVLLSALLQPLHSSVKIVLNKCSVHSDLKNVGQKIELASIQVF